MNLYSVSYRAGKRHLELFEEKLPIEQAKRQRVLSSRFLSSFTPKHYPRMFLDRRLRSVFDEETTP